MNLWADNVQLGKLQSTPRRKANQWVTAGRVGQSGAECGRVRHSRSQLNTILNTNHGPCDFCRRWQRQVRRRERHQIKRANASRPRSRHEPLKRFAAETRDLPPRVLLFRERDQQTGTAAGSARELARAGSRKGGAARSARPAGVNHETASRT
jgi:hypothetical protein